MSDEFYASVSKVDLPSRGLELLVRAMDGTSSWKKRYDSIFFLGMDAESLGLLES